MMIEQSEEAKAFVHMLTLNEPDTDSRRILK